MRLVFLLPPKLGKLKHVHGHKVIYNLKLGIYVNQIGEKALDEVLHKFNRLVVT